jgi:hypothetical protein
MIHKNIGIHRNHRQSSTTNHFGKAKQNMRVVEILPNLLFEKNFTYTI